VRELPFDVSNLCFWFHKFVPGVVRVMVDNNKTDDNALSPQAVQFLQRLSPQYFHTPTFQSVRYVFTKISSWKELILFILLRNQKAGDSQGLASNSQNEAWAGNSQRSNSGFDFSSQASIGRTTNSVLSNPYDTCLVVHVRLLLNTSRLEAQNYFCFSWRAEHRVG